jgi:hypothetical protein
MSEGLHAAPLLCTIFVFISVRNKCKFKKFARPWWLTPIALATWEAEIRRIEVLRPAQANSL